MPVDFSPCKQSYFLYGNLYASPLCLFWFWGCTWLKVKIAEYMVFSFSTLWKKLERMIKWSRHCLCSEGFLNSRERSYLFGFFLQCKNDEEIVAVIAHELGHWKLNHTMYSFIAVQVCCGCSLAIFFFSQKKKKLTPVLFILGYMSTMLWLYYGSWLFIYVVVE